MLLRLGQKWGFFYLFAFRWSFIFLFWVFLLWLFFCYFLKSDIFKKSIYSVVFALTTFLFYVLEAYYFFELYRKHFVAGKSLLFFLYFLPWVHLSWLWAFFSVCGFGLQHLVHCCLFYIAFLILLAFSAEKNYLKMTCLKAWYDSLESFKDDLYRYESLDSCYPKLVTILSLIWRDGKKYFL